MRVTGIDDKGCSLLRSADSSDILVFQGGKQGREDPWMGPEDIVINQREDRAGRGFDAAHHLLSLVGLGDGQDQDLVAISSIDRLKELANTPKVTRNRDNDDLPGVVPEPQLEAFGEGVLRVNGGDND